MAGPVYSTQFVLQHIVGGGTLTYTVPDGFVTVIRDIDCVIEATNPDQAVIDFRLNGVLFAKFAQSGELAAVHSWRGRVVAPLSGPLTPQVLEVFTTGLGVDYYTYVGGYLLSP